MNQNVVHGIKVHSDTDIVIKCMLPFDVIQMEHFLSIDNNHKMKRFLTRSLQNNHTDSSYLIIKLEERGYVDELIFHLFEEYVEMHYGWEQMIKNYLSALFLHLMRMKEELFYAVNDIGNESVNIAKIMICINKNYQSISLKELASDFNYHECYLSRMIKQHTKQSFRDLIGHIRMQEAEKLLKNTDLTVTEIAARVGYLNPNCLYKAFKDYHGVTPKYYKAQM